MVSSRFLRDHLASESDDDYENMSYIIKETSYTIWALFRMFGTFFI